MQSMWSGSISFGLVSVPVKMYVATKSHDTSFHQVHKEDLGRVRYIKRCEVCGRELRTSDIERAIEDNGATVVVDPGEVQGQGGAKSEIGIAAFVEAAQIDAVYLDRTYYLEPDDKGLKAYALLAQTLADTERVALGTVHLRNRTHMVALNSVEGLIRLQLLHWPDEIRAPHFAFRSEAPEVSQQELEMARMLVSTLEDDFEPENYVDTYEQRLQSLIEDRRSTAQEGSGQVSAPGGEVIDLLAVLQRSVDSVQDDAPRESAPRKSSRARAASDPDAKTAPRKRSAAAAQTPSKRKTTKKATKSAESPNKQKAG